MRDRQLAWSDPTLRELAEAFVPCADEVFRLQGGTDAECRLFQRFCDDAHYTTFGTTRQGIYAVTPNGVLLGSVNDRRPARIARMLRESLEKWNSLSADERRLSDQERAELATVWRWEDAWPEDGLVLEVTTRDLPRQVENGRPVSPSGREDRRQRWTERAWNRDHAWFRRDEAARFVPASPEPGTVHPVPTPLVERLVRFHLVDNVRGQTPPYAASDVRRAALTVTVTAANDDFVELALRGDTDAEVAEGEFPRRFTAELEGSARWSRAEGAFVSFELTAIGERSGTTRFNNRQRDLGPAPIGVVFRLAPADAPRISPAFVSAYGWERGAK